MTYSVIASSSETAVIYANVITQAEPFDLGTREQVGGAFVSVESNAAYRLARSEPGWRVTDRFVFEEQTRRLGPGLVREALLTRVLPARVGGSQASPESLNRGPSARHRFRLPGDQLEQALRLPR
jgi:hypothetical protein